MAIYWFSAKEFNFLTHTPPYLRRLKPRMDGWMDGWMDGCIHAYMHAYMHTYIHAYIHTYIHTYIYTYIHTYTHTHTPLHTHTHTPHPLSHTHTWHSYARNQYSTSCSSTCYKLSNRSQPFANHRMTSNVEVWLQMVADWLSVLPVIWGRQLFSV